MSIRSVPYATWMLIKTQWLHDRVIATLAVFDLTKFNIAAADPVNPGFNIGVGKVESTGFE